MRNSRRLVFGVATIGALFLFAHCGGSGDGGSTTGDSTTGGSTTGGSTTGGSTTGGSTTGGGGADMAMAGCQASCQESAGLPGTPNPCSCNALCDSYYVMNCAPASGMPGIRCICSKDQMIVTAVNSPTGFSCEGTTELMKAWTECGFPAMTTFSR